MVWSNIPFELKEINSFLIFHIKRWKPQFNFLINWAIILRIWGWNFGGGLSKQYFIDSTLRDIDRNKKSYISRDLLFTHIWERSKNFGPWFVVTPQNATNCMFPESTCLKTNFGTNLEFLVLAVAEKFLGKEDQFNSFFAFPAIPATFDRLHRFYRMIACFNGKNVSFKLTCHEI